jgi:centromere protein C
MVGSARRSTARKSDIYDLTPSPRRSQKRSYDESHAEDVDNIDGLAIPEPNGSYADITMAPAGDDSLQLPMEQEEEEVSLEREAELEPSVLSPVPQKKSNSRRATGTATVAQAKKGRQTQPTGRGGKYLSTNTGKQKKGSRASISRVMEPSISELDSEEPPKKRRTRPTAVKSSTEDLSDISQSIDESSTDLERTALAPKRRGGHLNFARDDIENSMPPPKSRGRKRETRQQTTVRRSIDAALGPSTVRGGSIPRSDVSEATKSNVVLRSQTPFEEPFGRTRSGRAIIPPINYYLGERVEYKSDGTLHNVVKAEIAPQLKRTNPRPEQQSRPRRREFSVFSETEEDELEVWEREEPGVLSGYVHRWDEELGRETDIIDEIGE